MLKAPNNRIAVDLDGEDLGRIKECGPDVLCVVLVGFITH